jgi:hypothetical protein
MDEKKAPVMVKVKFLEIWSADTGAYFPGQTAEILDDVATSLLGEHNGPVVELL